MKQTAVDFLDFKFLVERRMIKEDFQMVELCEIFDKAYEMQKEIAQRYAEFAIECDRKELPVLEFDGWINL
jgi:hypothetical protein